MTESRMADRPAAFWDAVREDYEAGKLTVREIHTKHDLTPGEFNYGKDRLGWKRRYQKTSGRKAIINRMFWLIDRLTRNLETEMNTANGKVDAKEVGILGQLVTMMGRLIELEGTGSPKATPRQTKQMSSIRAKLVERIAELKRN